MFCSIFFGGLAVLCSLPRAQLRMSVSVGLMFASSVCWLVAYLWCYERPAHERVNAQFKGYLSQPRGTPDQVWAVFNTPDGAVVVPLTIDPSTPYVPQPLVLFKRTLGTSASAIPRS